MKILNEMIGPKETQTPKTAREAYLEDLLTHYKLGHDNDVRQLERLEMELADRDECIYMLNKQCLSYQAERKKYEQMTNDVAIFIQRETIDLQQKEIENLKVQLSKKKDRIWDLERSLDFQERADQPT